MVGVVHEAAAARTVAATLSLGGLDTTTITLVAGSPSNASSARSRRSATRLDARVEVQWTGLRTPKPLQPEGLRSC